MSFLRSNARGVTSTLIVALVLALMVAMPSFTGPQIASAQTYNCPNGQVIYPGSGQTCPTTGTSSQFCSSNGQYIAAGSYCPTTGTNNSQYCAATGQYIAPGGYCGGTGTNTQYCSGNGQYVAAGGYCPSTSNTYGSYGSGYGTGTCVGGATPAFGASCTTGGGGPCASVALTVGQSCSSNGMITCHGQTTTPGAACSATSATQACARPATGVAGQACGTTTLSSAQTITCPGGGFAPTSQGCSASAQTFTTTLPDTTTTAAATTAAPSNTALTTAPATVAATSGFAVNVPAGWNIVAGPQGTTLPGVGGPLYTLQQGDTSYETVAGGTPLRSGVGYWAYLGSATATALATAGTGSVTVQLPAGQFIMIGNPGNTMATVSGAEAVLAFNPTTNSYNQTTQLAPGQGAWAFSTSGGQATIVNGAS